MRKAKTARDMFGIKGAFKTLGTGRPRRDHLAFARKNVNLGWVQTDIGHELPYCVGCRAIFNGLPGITAHQLGRFAAENCKPIWRRRMSNVRRCPGQEAERHG